MKWQPTSPDFAHSLLCLVQLVEGAQAKATYGLTLNYKPLEALVDRLLRDTTLSGEQVAEVLDGAGVIPFPDPFVEGFKWDEEGRLVYPGMEEEVCTAGFWEHLCAETYIVTKTMRVLPQSWNLAARPCLLHIWSAGEVC